ncbi:hypothetical protein P8452_61537 [Trifolium repens]|nr:hypothetical protein P8452_61537 [Trifolium repens]
MAAVQTLLLATFYSQVVSVVPNNSSLLSSIWYASISHSHSIFCFHSHSQDKKIKTFDVATWRLIRSYNHDKDFGEPIKVIMDPSCTYVVCSFYNKSIYIYDFMT